MLFVSRDEIVAAGPTGGDGLLTMQYAMLKANHDSVQFAQRRHQRADTGPFTVGADGTAGDAVVAGTPITFPGRS